MQLTKSGSGGSVESAALGQPRKTWGRRLKSIERRIFQKCRESINMGRLIKIFTCRKVRTLVILSTCTSTGGQYLCQINNISNSHKYEYGMNSYIKPSPPS